LFRIADDCFSFESSEEWSRTFALRTERLLLGQEAPGGSGFIGRVAPLNKELAFHKDCLIALLIDSFTLAMK
jgi:hypothetical protein